MRWQVGGDRRARDELARRFLPLARKLAQRYRRGGEPFDDLVQVASLGLLKAIDRFDADRGNAFSSFAVPTIVGELKRHFRDTGWLVHVPRGVKELALKVEAAEGRLTSRSGRSPTVPELAQHLEVRIEEVLEALEAARAHRSSSLDAEAEDANEPHPTIAESLGEEDERFALLDATVTIAAAAGELSEKQRLVLGLYFLEGRSQLQIAQQIGISQMQVSRVLRGALERLRELIDSAPEHIAGG